MRLLNSINTIATSKQKKALGKIEHLDKRLLRHFKSKFSAQMQLTRSLVSFQANKGRPAYRWYKYEEAFSATLVEHIFREYGIAKGTILDPFAGSGTALFAARSMGIKAEGIELLPIGQEIIAAKKLLETEFTLEDLNTLKRWSMSRVWEQSDQRVRLTELRITKGAYRLETKKNIEKYLTACQQENMRVQMVLRFALLCVLESISFTRKDGQYLRWDYRARRKWGKKTFDKGKILGFKKTIEKKINEIVSDLGSRQQAPIFPSKTSDGEIRLYRGSCLDILPALAENHYDAIITSPPYCNRYDYTRTYALELALLGAGEQELAKLRQEMLSCTVESREKDLVKINPRWTRAVGVADRRTQEKKIRGRLNAVRL